MTQCKWCKADMTDRTTTTCKANITVTFPDKEVLETISYGIECEHRCHDCNVSPGGYHHPCCDMEECPRCNGQLISCGCLDKKEDTNGE